MSKHLETGTYLVVVTKQLLVTVTEFGESSQEELIARCWQHGERVDVEVVKQ